MAQVNKFLKATGAGFMAFAFWLLFMIDRALTWPMFWLDMPTFKDLMGLPSERRRLSQRCARYLALVIAFLLFRLPIYWIYGI